MRRDLNLYVTKAVTIRQRVEDEMFSRLPAQNSRAVMAGHSRSKNGAAELVIRPATSGRTRWLAYVPAIHGATRRGRACPAIHNFVPRCETSMPATSAAMTKNGMTTAGTPFASARRTGIIRRHAGYPNRQRNA